jgi:hypothetical protein
MRVYRDIHGIYVRMRRAVYRPIMPVQYAHIYPSITRYVAGDEVRGGPITDSELARVGGEVWYNHGTYYDAENHPTVPSEALFKPQRHQWPE